MKKYLTLFLIIVMTLSMNTIVFAQNTEDENTSTIVENDDSLNDVVGPDTENYINEYNALLKGTGDNTQVEGVFLNNFASYYFSQLGTNFGFNHKGTCSYVAAAMLLSYYDTYWDDNIILNQYEEIIDNFDSNLSLEENAHSPGIKGDEKIIDPIKEALGIPANGTLNDSVYYPIVSNYASTYFHFNLLEIGINQLSKSNGMYPWDIEDLLEYYLYNQRGYDSSKVTVERKKFDTQNNLKSYIINKVKYGIPVIVCAGYWEGELKGHSFVIYDYDEENDEMYCHLGNKNGKYHVKFSTIAYSTIGGVISLCFTNEHSHSNNYVDVSGTEYCSCDLFTKHPNHECRHYKEYDNNYHQYMCGCSDELFRHNFVCDGTENGEHYVKCTDCGHRTNKIKAPQYTSISSTQHSISCSDCEYTVMDTHTYTYQSNGLNSHILTCKYCGETQGNASAHVWVDSEQPNTIMCKHCGHLKKLGFDDFIPIIKNKIKIEEETE